MAGFGERPHCAIGEWILVCESCRHALNPGSSMQCVDPFSAGSSAHTHAWLSNYIAPRSFTVPDAGAAHRRPREIAERFTFYKWVRKPHLACSHRSA